jgi:hypothetical protein
MLMLMMMVVLEERGDLVRIGPSSERDGRPAWAWWVGVIQVRSRVGHRKVYLVVTSGLFESSSNQQFESRCSCMYASTQLSLTLEVIVFKV